MPRTLQYPFICFLALSLSHGIAAATGAFQDKTRDPIAAERDQVLFLEVVINAHSIGKIGEFTLRRGRLLATRGELGDLGLLVPASLIASSDGLIALSDLPGLTWDLDQQTQELRISVSNKFIQPIILHSNAEEARSTEPRVIESGTGVTLNYDLLQSIAVGKSGATGSLDFRAFTPHGVFSTDWLAHGGATPGSSGQITAIRLDSAYSYADVNSLRRYALGDFISAGLIWSRPIHLEGAQIRSDFSMRPDLVTFPLPSIRGSAAVPSTVDILVDGNLAISSQVGTGPFQTTSLPVVSGAGTISMTTTNALGQQVFLRSPFYASSTLLAPGLQTFGGQAGLVRRDWGSVSNDYGKPAGTAFYRRGLSPRFTVEASFEGTVGTSLSGAGGVFQVGSLGVVNFAAEASTGSGHSAAELTAGAQRIGRRFSLGASSTLAQRSFRDVASMNGSSIPRKQLSAFTSLSLKRYGSVGDAYVGLDQDATPSPDSLTIGSAQHSKIVTANYSLQIHHMSLYAATYRSLTGTSSDSSLQAGLTIPLGKRVSLEVSASSDASAQVQVQRSASQVGDWGYNFYLSTDGSNHEFGQLLYKSRVGLFNVGLDQDAGVTTLQLESQGALSFVDRRFFPSNTIYDSFAIVDTGALPHVRVVQENRDVGKTGSSGRLLVPDLRSFDLNHISIQATDIPADATLQGDRREVRPQDRSGVVVRFPIKFSHGALLRLVDETGAPIPLGSVVTLRATGAQFPVGYDGDAYVEELGPHNQIAVELTDGRHCSVAADFTPVPGDIPTIGPLRCLEIKP